MAFENISAFKLKAYMNSIDVNPNKLNGVLGDVDTGSWDSTASSTIRNAIEDLKSNYNDIKKIKEAGKEIANLIEDYKDVEKKIRSTKNKLAIVNAITDKDKKNSLERNYESDLQQYRTKLKNLENQINGYL